MTPFENIVLTLYILAQSIFWFSPTKPNQKLKKKQKKNPTKIKTDFHRKCITEMFA